jgi:hypothetical protein
LTQFPSKYSWIALVHAQIDLVDALEGSQETPLESLVADLDKLNQRNY